MTDKLNQFQWATVEDLQLNPALTLFTNSSIEEAQKLMVSFDYSQLPIVTKQRDLVGYVTLKNLQNNLQSGKVTPTSTLDKVMYPFKKNINYELITLDTLLIDLDRFFNKRNTVAFITDDQLKFCIGVVTQFDLDLFLGKRSRLNEFN